MTTKRRRGVPPGSDSARTQGVELNPRECSTTDIAKAALRRWVAFIPFDDPTRHVMVDTTLLRAVGCRSASMILHQPPDTLIGDVAAWNVNIERAILCTFLKSLNCGELLFPEDMCIYDALKMFEMECVSVPSGVVVLFSKLFVTCVCVCPCCMSPCKNNLCTPIPPSFSIPSICLLSAVRQGSSPRWDSCWDWPIFLL